MFSGFNMLAFINGTSGTTAQKVADLVQNCVLVEIDCLTIERPYFHLVIIIPRHDE